jgi:hypothetical protein
MPRARWISVSGRQIRLSDLAREHNLLPQTLWGRLERNFGLERALSTGIWTAAAAGRRGAAGSCWKNRSAGT